jgi:four helix bundle protein
MCFALQQDVFKISKNWPAEERFSLTDQVRRSSRSKECWKLARQHDQQIRIVL